MKKTPLLFSLAMAFTVVGCTNSNTPAEVETIDTAQNNTGWQSADIQPTSMPSTMNQSVSVPNYNSGAYGVSSESVGNCQIVRDGMGTPIYAQMVKGCYTGNTYTVGAKDTLFFIAFLTGTNPQQLADLNGISTTTKLKVGQSLRVR